MTSARQGTIALLHFHAHVDLCRSRVAWLHRFNPDLQVYGLYGGDEAHAVQARALEGQGLAHVHYDSSKPPEWNKKHTDLAVAAWFRDVGRSIPFDRVHVIQWDLVFFAPLDRVYPRIPAGAVGLTGLTALAAIARSWPWTAEDPLASDSARLFGLARDRYGYNANPQACIGPGYSLSREFLDRSHAIDLGEAGHDELRLPLLAQLLGIVAVDTRFYSSWGDPAVERVFNADGHEVDVREVQRQLSLPLGRRVFHPCREAYDARTLEYLVTSLRG